MTERIEKGGGVGLVDATQVENSKIEVKELQQPDEGRRRTVKVSLLPCTPARRFRRQSYGHGGTVYVDRIKGG